MKSLATAAILMATLALTASPVFADPAIAPAGCPQAAEELPELLASAMQSEGREGEVNATFDVDKEGVVRSITLQGSRQYQSRVRTALESMDCSGGTPQHYALKIRFAESTPLRTVMTAASAQATGHPR